MKSIIALLISLSIISTPMNFPIEETEIIPICTVKTIADSTATPGLQWATIEINDVMNEEFTMIQVPFGAGIFQEGQTVNFFWLLDFAMIDKIYSETTIEYILYDSTIWVIEK